MELEFKTEDVDYSLADFYDHFHTELPQVVKVSEGFHGDHCEHTFVKGEVLYMAAVSKQKRVVAKAHTGQYNRILSIPLSFPEALCVSKLGKCGNEQSLQEILKRHWLPVKVRYPPSNVIIMEDMTFNTSNLPQLELVKKFDEIHLLGNHLVNGRLGKDMIRIPVYLTQLRLCRVTGMRYLTQEGWTKHCDKLKEDSENYNYDINFGNQHTAEYDKSKIHFRTKYAFTEPLLYDDLIDIIIRWPECNIGCSSRDSETKEIGMDENSLQTVEEDSLAYECLSQETEFLDDSYEAISVNKLEDKLTKSIKDLTCDEVVERLINLGLEKYAEMFATNMVDGELLVHIDESILMDEFGMTKEELTRLKDDSHQKEIDTTAPIVPLRSYFRKQGVQQDETSVPNQKPKLLPKPKILTPPSSIDISKQRPFDNPGRQCTHAEPNAYTPMPKQLTGILTAKLFLTKRRNRKERQQVIKKS